MVYAPPVYYARPYPYYPYPYYVYPPVGVQLRWGGYWGGSPRNYPRREPPHLGRR